MTDRELFKMALNALEAHADIGINATKQIEALRARLAQPEPEPVAWMRKDKGHIGFHKVAPSGYVPLYTAPPQSKWVELTKEECFELCVKHKDAPFSLLLAVEDKSKEKNGY